MNDQAFDWIRWFTHLRTNSDDVSQEVVGKWADWFASFRQREKSQNQRAWEEAIPPTVGALSNIAKQLKAWITGLETPPEGVDLAGLAERVESLEKEIARMKAEAAASDDS